MDQDHVCLQTLELQVDFRRAQQNLLEANQTILHMSTLLAASHAKSQRREMTVLHAQLRDTLEENTRLKAEAESNNKLAMQSTLQQQHSLLDDVSDEVIPQHLGLDLLNMYEQTAAVPAPDAASVPATPRAPTVTLAQPGKLTDEEKKDMVDCGIGIFNKHPDGGEDLLCWAPKIPQRPFNTQSPERQFKAQTSQGQVEPQISQRQRQAQFDYAQHKCLADNATFIEMLAPENEKAKWQKFSHEHQRLGYQSHTVDERRVYYHSSVRPSFLEREKTMREVVEGREAAGKAGNGPSTSDTFNASKATEVREVADMASHTANVRVAPNASNTSNTSDASTAGNALDTSNDRQATQLVNVRADDNQDTVTAADNAIDRSEVYGVADATSAEPEMTHDLKGWSPLKEVMEVQSFGGSAHTIAAMEEAVAQREQREDARAEDNSEMSIVPKSREDSFITFGIEADFFHDDIREMEETSEGAERDGYWVRMQSDALEEPMSSTPRRRPIQVNDKNAASRDNTSNTRSAPPKGPMLNIDIGFSQQNCGGHHKYRLSSNRPYAGQDVWPRVQANLSSTDKSQFHTVVITGIPVNITLEMILDKVRGGRVVSASFLAMSNMNFVSQHEKTNGALIVFFTAARARTYVDFCNENQSMIFKTAGTKVQLLQSPTYSCPAKKRTAFTPYSDGQDSRVVFICPNRPLVGEFSVVPTPGQFKHWDDVQGRRPSFFPVQPLRSYTDGKDGARVFEFASVQDARMGIAGLNSDAVLQHFWTGFALDPCEQALGVLCGAAPQKDQDMEKKMWFGASTASDWAEENIGMNAVGGSSQARVREIDPTEGPGPVEGAVAGAGEEAGKEAIVTTMAVLSNGLRTNRPA